MRIEEIFGKVTDSGDATVGGGAASAIAGAMAAGLVSMVSLLSRGRELGLDDAAYVGFAEELKAISEEFRAGAYADEVAFLGIKAALALPKATDEEKSTRRGALSAAAITAADVPLENAGRTVRVLEIVAALEGKYNTSAASDMECGRMLARSALSGCLLNVEANLPMIKDPGAKERLEKASEELKRLL
ncbi:MAG: cyclodeaminase/cyclohydrolase family protein [Synergistaceae bacterium]|jgi:formiminotetrahydrofolate cyclodeaminase|nr:cyclodeaminase/cyclohydrolase family protein [Synergistaceae bacterium]